MALFMDGALQPYMLVLLSEPLIWMVAAGCLMVSGLQLYQSQYWFS